MMDSRSHARIVPLLLLTLLAAPAQSEDLYDTLTRVERRTVDRILEERDLELEPSPEGLFFGHLIIVNEPVYSRAETPGLVWLNAFVETTPSWVVRQEVRWEVGTLYDVEQVWTTLRNLRRRSQLSVVAVLPVRNEEVEGLVDMLIVTRDTHAFRATFDQAPGEEARQQQFLTLPEWNVMGIHRRTSVLLTVAPDTFTIGPVVGSPNLAGSDITVREELGITFNYRDLVPEGTTNNFIIGRPVWKDEQRWGFGLAEEHDLRIARYMRGPFIRTWDDPATPDIETVPYEFEATVIDALAEGFLGIGRRGQQVVSFGYGVSYRDYDLIDRQLDSATRVAFENDVLGIDELSSFLAGGFRISRLSYHTVWGYQTMGFSEDIRLGPEMLVDLRLALTPLGSDTDYTHAYLFATWTGMEGDWIMTGEAHGGLRLDLDSLTTYDRRIGGSFHVATPLLGFFRFHLGGAANLTFDRLTEALQEYGQDSGLRGFPFGWFVGDGHAVGHLEARTLPLELYYQLFGLVLFADVGAVFDELDPSLPLTDVGIGLRWVIPWYSASPLRFDVAIPLTGPAIPSSTMITIATEQAF